MPSYPSGPKGSVVSKFTGDMEKNNFKQGREGAATMKKPGPASGRTLGVPVDGGGIVKPTNPSHGQ